MPTTLVKNVGDLWEERQLVAALIPHLSWRWHGIGLLQAYVREGDERELRVHIWSPRLMLDGIRESGSAHNHRFTLTSSVLVGELEHVEWHLTGDPNGDHDLWDFPHARLQTEATRSLMHQVGERCTVEKRRLLIKQGQRYTFERFAYHSSFPVSDVVVTLVEKTEQEETKARVVAPLAQPPVPAFGGDDLGQREPATLLEHARKALLDGHVP